MNTSEISILERELNSFDLDERKSALVRLSKLVQNKKIHLPKPDKKINMHCHTFFSFNAYGHSPISLVWLAKTQGFQLVGMVDFDVLEGVDEFLDACELIQMNGTAGIETRVFIPEFGNDEINSPGEPGVAYHMGIGFPAGLSQGTSKEGLSDLRQRADNRNQTVINLVNQYLSPVSINYQADVWPLTPANTPTERHIILAYIQKVEDTIGDQNAFWSKKLAIPVNEVDHLRHNPADFQNTIRSKLVKRGGPGYIIPNPNMFPTVDTFHQIITESKALPCFAWLDGTSSGEQKIEQLLDLLVSKGVVTVNIIPDRNWNIKDTETKNKKVQHLYKFVELARKMELPINVGTEMNSFGQKIVDDFHNEVLTPLWKDFSDGAFFVYGHTIMERYFQMGYQSNWAKSSLHSRKNLNEFFMSIGYSLSMNKLKKQDFSWINFDLRPDEILRRIRKGEFNG